MCDFELSDGEAVIPPSSMFVLLPGEEPPLAEEIRLRLLDWGVPAPDAEGQTPEETLWSFWFEVADRPAAYLIWCEQVVGSHLAFLDGVRWRCPEHEHEARSCRWMVGVEGSLSLRQPAADYQFQLGLCEAIGRDWAPVLYDANSFLFRTQHDVRPLVHARTPPRTSCLFSIHKVRSNRGKNEEERYWLHTHGLERAGIPDLEIFDVPFRLLPAACELLEATADLWIEFSTPAPQVPVAIGHELRIAWRPWQAVVAELERYTVGGWAYRREDHGHAGYRGVLVAPQEKGWFSRRWAPPLAALEKLTDSSTTLYKTSAETRRMAGRARERWADFGILFAGRHPADWRFAVKLSFATADASAPGEHLWFDVVGIQPGRICGRLVSQPTHIRDLQPGDVHWYDIQKLSDWRIFTPQGTFDPDNAGVLLEEGVLV